MARLQLPSEAEIIEFVESVPIATKDQGVIKIKMWGSQRALLRALLVGLRSGVHQFWILKHRQGGISTFLLLLTIFWMGRFPGLQGLTVTDSEENRQYFRDVFLQMLETVHEEESTATFLGDERTKNQMQIAWPNQSRLLLQMAGPRTWQRLGVGRGLSFCHGTEMGLWSKGHKAITYLRAAFSDKNPYGLYIFEGTARGKNWYYDAWESAKRAKAIRPIFLGWWLREDYRLKHTDPRWAAYNDPTLTKRERAWVTRLKEDHGVTLTLGQWAWRRWYVAEEASGDERLADQEMPTVPDDAFEATQERPFLDGETRERIEHDVDSAAPPARYAYVWGTHIEESSVLPASLERPGQLRVWGPPDARPVIIAAVPAHSSFEGDPTWVVSAWAASMTREQIEQVAEFAVDYNVGLQPFSWVILHLAGAYAAHRTRSLVLEVAGFGSGVLSELRRMAASGFGTRRYQDLAHVLGGIQHYIWRRPDSLGAYGALQWKSTPETQGTALLRLRDQIVRGAVVIRSDELLGEAARLEADGDTYTLGDRPGGNRVMAAALAVEGWASQVYPVIHRLRGSYRGIEAPQSVAQRSVQDFFHALGRRA